MKNHWKIVIAAGVFGFAFAFGAVFLSKPDDCDASGGIWVDTFRGEYICISKKCLVGYPDGR